MKYLEYFVCQVLLVGVLWGFDEQVSLLYRILRGRFLRHSVGLRRREKRILFCGQCDSG
jgi:hypothetical protein